MKRTAIQACRILAESIFDSATHPWMLWRQADRIERRWHIQGATDAHLRTLTLAREQFLREERAKHDRMFPDRLTYLHR